MSILSFLDTVYDTYQNSQRNKLPGTFNLVNNTYDYNTFRYPLDIGNYDKGHYMVIHINQQKKTQFQVQTTTDKPTAIQNLLDLQAKRGRMINGSVLGDVVSSGGGYLKDAAAQYTDSLAEKVRNIPGDFTDGKTVQSIGNFVGQLGGELAGFNTDGFLRTITRTTDSVVLYMPDTLNFNYAQLYDQLNVGTGTASGLLAAGISIYDEIQKNGMAVDKNVISPFVLSGLQSKFGGAIGDIGRAGVFAINQMVRNPMLELIYSQPQLRSFQFDFKFYPRDEKEALEVQNIIERLRFHQAPEIKSGTAGYFLIPPSEFDIKFYYNGSVNPNIDKISTCVLEQINVNYAPQGFTAYESANELRPGLGRTGMPVSIDLTLMFKETQIMTKDNFRFDTKSSSVTGTTNPVTSATQSFPVGPSGTTLTGSVQAEDLILVENIVDWE
jgi:hypothetical protein